MGRPATADRIDAAQRRMSVAFPADLVASLRRHDGLSAASGCDLPPFYAPSALDDILLDWQVNCRVAGGWDRAFVPFAKAVDGGCRPYEVSAGRSSDIRSKVPATGSFASPTPG
ncbi:SMI1/KNR4 family protein [Actinoplanes sp. NPDC048988]|uniref:SMI1/KNR4 family protein n=1 Tax=Actinoplanes sp. NPDC048988 TaxID=3363901 RepID=UPI00371AC65D